MRYSVVAERLPGFLRRHVLYFEALIEREVGRFAAETQSGSFVLDAGAGESRHARHFAHARYIGIDLGIGDAAWNYRDLDAIGDLGALPLRDGSMDACLNIVTLEHVREPARVAAELARVLRPGGRMLFVVPHEWEVHQSPHDYYRYTRHGMRFLMESAGFEAIEIEAAGGYFRLLARRLLNGLQFFSGGVRWLGFLPAAMFLVPPAIILPWLDFLDRERNFTLGYVCRAQKPGRP